LQTRYMNGYHRLECLFLSVEVELASIITLRISPVVMCHAAWWLFGEI
jgi:hypothetical protein